MIESEKLQSLLTQVMLVHARYASQQSVAGEQFNIFQILGIESNEVRTHSAFLAELLNPAGSHGLSSRFLKLFFRILSIPDVEADGARVEVEKHIGTITDDHLTGGRIDICVFPKEGRAVFIENKIYAADQKHQLLRYHNYDPNAKLIYLTLDGTEPGEYSTGDQLAAESVLVVSYSTDIIAWLEECRREAAMQPLVRESITQYINLLKKLTGQSTNKMMTEEIKQLLLRSSEHLTSAQQMSNAFHEIQAEVQRALHEELNSALDRVLMGVAPHSKDGIFMRYRGYDIKFAYDADNTGYFWGFPAYDQNGKGGICKQGEFDEFYSFLRSFDSQFKRSSWWAGWLHPSGFTRVDRCSAQQLHHFSSPEARQALAAQTAKQASDCIEKLLIRFGVDS